MAADGSPLNTCTSEALVEMLQFLKRAFWPFPWDTSANQGSGGGFAGAAQVSILERPESALAHLFCHELWVHSRSSMRKSEFSTCSYVTT